MSKAMTVHGTSWWRFFELNHTSYCGLFQSNNREFNVGFRVIIRINK